MASTGLLHPRLGPGPSPPAGCRIWRQSIKAHRGYRQRAVQTMTDGAQQSWTVDTAGEAARPLTQPSDNGAAPLVLYDPEREQAYFRQHQLLVAGRMVTLTARATQFLMALAAERLDSAIHGIERGGHAPARTLQRVVTQLGPCFVKLAQTLSMRPDLIGEAYAQTLSELQVLQDSVAPFSNSEAFAILEAELGRPVGEVFSWISKEPVASASLGQVYRAVLASSREEVAVKIQRPGVEPTVALDVYLLRWFIGVAQKAAGIRRDLRVVADEIGRSLYGELDFRLEAEHGEEFLRAHSGLHFVTIPRVVKELTTRRVLIMEWVDGQSPTQLLARSEGGPKGAVARARILSMVRMGIQCSLAQLLVTGVMHGDPHSGNLLLTRDGRLCYLDFGMLVKVTPQHRQAMMCALIHMGLGDWRRLVDDLAALDLLKPETNRRELADDLEMEFNAVLSEQGAQSAPHASPLGRQLPLLSLQTTALSFGALTAVLFRVAFKYKFMLPAYFPLVIRSVASLEGVALLVDPNFKLISAGMPIVLHQLLSDRRPAAQQLLRELLLGPGGALRTDATAQQIMQVWATARQQALKAAAAEAEAAPSAGPILLGGPSMSGPSLQGSVLGSVDLSSEDEALAGGAGGPSTDELDLGSLLLDPENAPLRRVLMDVNPALTVASMQPAMRETVRQLAVDVLSPVPLRRLLGLEGGSSSGFEERMRRRRLQLVATAQSRLLAKAPFPAVVQLLAFTAQIAASIALIKLRGAWSWLRGGVQRLLARGGEPQGGQQSRGVSGTQPRPAFA